MRIRIGSNTPASGIAEQFPVKKSRRTVSGHLFTHDIFPDLATQSRISPVSVLTAHDPLEWTLIPAHSPDPASAGGVLLDISTAPAISAAAITIAMVIRGADSRGFVPAASR